ncbi:PREDICTED: G-type lectin S-receptor-like serine/threonine-protein kinase At1g11410 isoform X1 [Camelina sativa]|uniref:Receptor-like serine/threonine-protein kinase n=1 Tax=Camelina sativa TaxID=90675 RepID=A0ABM1R744_CAMSA|nr:PREDICTED: G-type lectin S-receptor-like serine/threonine-protein kinase At1g11410 isoform X1 [Camelina sativa]
MLLVELRPTWLLIRHIIYTFQQTLIRNQQRMKIFFIFFIFLLSLLFQSCLSDNTIQRRQSLKDGDVVFSEGKRFSFGFFSLGNSKLRYVGIWYAQVSEQTVVWVANRDHPINDTSGLIKFSSRGNLCVYASVNGTEPLWSTGVIDMISEPALVAKLTDLGNLVLLDPVTGKSFWESFNHPTNTLLPFMKFGFTRQDDVDRIMTSWRSPGDPGPGNITYRIERRGFPQMMMYKGPTLWWRTGSWTGQRWSGVPEMTNKFIFNFIFNVSFVSNPDEVSITYGVLDASIITRMVLNETGTLQRFSWNGRDKRWIGFWSAPEDKCDVYNHCGFNGYCDSTSTDKFECSCLPGYEPRTPRDWFLRDASDGCARIKAASICNGKEGFAKLKRVKIPNTSSVNVDMNITLKECEQRCLKNCSCVAYASAYHESEDGEKGCLTWHGNMLDTRTYLSSGQDFYLRVDKAELARWNGNGSSGKRRLFVILISLAVVVMLLMITLFCFIRKRRHSIRRRKTSRSFAPSSFDLEDSFILEELEDKSRSRELPLFELSTIAAATNNFAFQNKLGAGGFGPVYKGVLQNGMEIAVKRLSKNSGQGMEEFKNEVKLISKLQHRNLVRILGCCVEFEEKMLVYEYLPNKSLDYFVFHEEQRAELDWPKRMGIIRGIARGVLYLHQDSRLRIIHRDLKASNVLLDNEMIPKIADFGLARIFGGNQIEGSTNRVVGTYGYMSPEYAMDGQFSIKSDVYSFGVLILEIVTGKKNSAFYEESLNLVKHIWDLWEKGQATEIIDNLMGEETYDESEVMKCIHIGLLCVQENASDRPDMSSVVFMLGHNAIDLPSPKHPAFTAGRRRNVKSGGSSDNWPTGETGSTVNDVTLSDVQGR